jgi:hypothetical protein
VNHAHRARAGWAGTHRPSPLLGASLLTAATLLLGALTGCSSTPPAAAGTSEADQTIHDLGRVPIPSAPATAPTPTASPDHPQLLAIGARVHADLPGGTSAVVTALGPQVTVPITNGKPPDHADGTITITATDTTGTLALPASAFTSRDDKGREVHLSATGPATVTASQGQPVTLKLTGTFDAGSAQITWRDHDKVIAVWDFTVELD